MKNRTAHVVIVGGGFAGIKVARELRNEPGVHITLISDQPDFRYSPALYRTATGHTKENLLSLYVLCSQMWRTLHSKMQNSLVSTEQRNT